MQKDLFNSTLSIIQMGRLTKMQYLVEFNYYQS